MQLERCRDDIRFSLLRILLVNVASSDDDVEFRLARLTIARRSGSELKVSHRSAWGIALFLIAMCGDCLALNPQFDISQYAHIARRVQHFARVLHMTRAQTKACFALLAETAVEETRAKGVFVFPGIGRLVTIKRKIRLGRSPQTGQTIEIKSKTLIRLRVAKKAADFIASSSFSC
jgi:nucleoid DNA-binding protein